MTTGVVIVECRFCARAASKTLMVAIDDDWRCKSAPACERRVRAIERAKNAGRCVDCVAEGITTERKLATDADGKLRPGPRCVTHQRAVKKARSAATHGKRVEKNFGISPEQYWALYEMQGGKCFICQVASGKTKRLAVEHEHGLCDDHPPEQGCPRCIRSLSCGRCNRLVAFLGVEALSRAIQNLVDPPARAWLNQPDEAMSTEIVFWTEDDDEPPG